MESAASKEAALLAIIATTPKINHDLGFGSTRNRLRSAAMAVKRSGRSELQMTGFFERDDLLPKFYFNRTSLPLAAER